MDLFEAIHSRRTIRTFTGKKIPKSDLEKIVDAGRVAPSAVNRQLWDFVVVSDKEILDDILHHFNAGRKYDTHEDGKFDGCSAIIAVIVSESNEYWKEDGCSATVNMLLAARALGWGSCWIEGGLRPHEDHFKEILSVPKEKRMLLMIALGEPVKWSPPPMKKSVSEIIHWDKY
jgi:nitroreductase